MTKTKGFDAKVSPEEQGQSYKARQLRLVRAGWARNVEAEVKRSITCTSSCFGGLVTPSLLVLSRNLAQLRVELTSATRTHNLFDPKIFSSRGLTPAQLRRVLFSAQHLVIVSHCHGIPSRPERLSNTHFEDRTNIEASWISEGSLSFAE